MEHWTLRKGDRLLVWRAFLVDFGMVNRGMLSISAYGCMSMAAIVRWFYLIRFCDAVLDSCPVARQLLTRTSSDSMSNPSSSPSFPSSGLSLFFSKPGKWFVLTASSCNVNFPTIDGPKSSSSSRVLSSVRNPIYPVQPIRDLFWRVNLSWTWILISASG